jgi:hypothetical protein
MDNTCPIDSAGESTSKRKVSPQPDEHLMSINDNLPSSSPSGKTMLRLLAAVLALAVLIVMYYKIIGF